MSHKRRRHRGPYEQPNIRRNRTPFSLKKVWKNELFGVTVSKQTEEIKCNTAPSEISEKSDNSVSGSYSGFGGSISKKKENKTKF